MSGTSKLTNIINISEENKGGFMVHGTSRVMKMGKWTEILKQDD
jgi:hypothetical protein